MSVFYNMVTVNYYYYYRIFKKNKIKKNLVEKITLTSLLWLDVTGQHRLIITMVTWSSA